MAPEWCGTGKTTKGHSIGHLPESLINFNKNLMKPGVIYFCRVFILEHDILFPKTIPGFETPESVIKSGDRLFVST
jgi:hypothetical protein